MNRQELDDLIDGAPEPTMAQILALPDPDLLTTTTLEDPPGAGRYYSARTVIALLEAVAVRRNAPG